MNSRKQEPNGDETNNSSSKIFSSTTTTAPSSSSRQSWAGFKNPRIVRVSRTFGGKDRHSKVCTVKGLRDRRIRLSVQTAIQLYDLQDRLGLNQPSKVVDWLIDVTKNDIDKLPPLQMPPPSLSHLFNLKDHGSNHQETTEFGKEKWIATNNEQENSVSLLSSQSSNFFQSSNFNMAFNNNVFMSHNWEPNSNLSLGPFGNYNSLISSSQTDQQNMSFPSSSQLYFCPNNGTTLSSSLIVPPYNNSNLINHFHPNSLVMPTLQLISTPVKSSFSLNNGNPSNNKESDDLDHNHKEGNGS